jgi:hypothetical protein
MTGETSVRNTKVNTRKNQPHFKKAVVANAKWIDKVLWLGVVYVRR